MTPLRAERVIFLVSQLRCDNKECATVAKFTFSNVKTNVEKDVSTAYEIINYGSFGLNM